MKRKWEIKEEKRRARLAAQGWQSGLPDAEITVVVLIKPTDDVPYVTAAYWTGSRWRVAIGSGAVTGVIGWMEMHDVVARLSAKAVAP